MTRSPRQLRLGAFFFTPGSHSAGWRHPLTRCRRPTCPSRTTWPWRRPPSAGCLDCIFFQDTAAVNGSAGLDGGSLWRPAHGAPGVPRTRHADRRAGAGDDASSAWSRPRPRPTTTPTPSRGASARWTTSPAAAPAGTWSPARSRTRPAISASTATPTMAIATNAPRNSSTSAPASGTLRGRRLPRATRPAAGYLDPSKGHILNHQATHFRVRGPLNLPRTPQGRPVIAQAGSSEDGRRLASRIADMIFTAQSRAVRGPGILPRDQVPAPPRMAATPDDVKVMPGFMAILGDDGCRGAGEVERAADH